MRFRFLTILAILSLGLLGCSSSGYSGSASYRVSYHHGYGYPGYYPRGYMGPPVYVRPRPPTHRPPANLPARPGIPAPTPMPMRR